MSKSDKTALLWVVVAFFVILSLIVIWRGTNIIEKGEYGVVAQFGDLEDNVLMPGLNFVWPWKTVYRIPSTIQKDEEDASTPTKEGLTCNVHCILMWKIDPKKVVDIVRQYGHTDYEDRIVDPFFRAAIRDTTVHFDSESLYTQDRSKVETMVFDKVSKTLMQHGIIAESINLTDLKLPDSVKQRIEAKVAAEQDVKRMEFVLKQKELEGQVMVVEAEAKGKAKVVEAESLAKAQVIITKDLSINYLYYLWIQGLRDGNNLIYVPTGGDGLPMFRGLTEKMEKKKE